MMANFTSIMAGLGATNFQPTRNPPRFDRAKWAIGTHVIPPRASSQLRNASRSRWTGVRGQIAVRNNGNLTNAAVLRDELGTTRPGFQTTVDSEISYAAGAAGIGRVVNSIQGTLRRTKVVFMVIMTRKGAVGRARTRMGSVRCPSADTADGGGCCRARRRPLIGIHAQFVAMWPRGNCDN